MKRNPNIPRSSTQGRLVTPAPAPAVRRACKPCRRASLALGWLPIVLLVFPRPAAAEDSVERRGQATAMRGDVTAMSRTEIVVTGRTSKREYRIPAIEVERVRWDGEKPQVNQFRNDERNGHFEKAIEGYSAALKEAPVSATNMRADLEFLIARTTAARALAESDGYDEAIERLEKFRAAHANNFRYFEVLRLLARLYMAKPDVEQAGAALKQLSEAPWTDLKMDAQLMQARVALARDDVAAALPPLEEVIAQSAKTPAELSRRYEALLTKAACLQKQGKLPEATEVLSSVIDEAAEEDTRTLAETCVRLGDCLQAAGRTKEAILAYLRVDILFPKEKAAHAEALFHLSRLLAKDGKPDKAADAAARLQERYPKSPWTAKLRAAPK
jgi:tetratricopeptide (TPR) repeat protein